MRTLATARVPISALAQDGRRIAWLQPRMRRNVVIKDLVSGRRVSLPANGFESELGVRPEDVLPSIALAGNRVVYVLYEESGNTQQDFYIVTTSVRDRTERFVGLETQGNCPCLGPLPTWPLAADGPRALFTLRGGVYRLAGRRAVRVQGRKVGDLLAVSGTRYASAWLRDSGGCLCSRDPSWSPDGSRIALGTGSGRIAIVSARGGPPATIASGRHPDWSPDGSLIAFDRAGVGPSADAAYVMRPDGTQVRRVLFGIDPDWHPDGRRLAFVRDSAIHVAALGVPGARRVTQGEQPAWSPDGLRLAYSEGGDIYVVNADGSGTIRLTAGRAGDEVYDVEPAWSPDGQQIAYSLRVVAHDTGELRDAQVRVMRADGSDNRELAGRALTPGWSPDGSRVAYAGWLPRRDPVSGRFSTEIFSSAPDGAGPIRVTTTVVPEPVSGGFVRTLTKPRRSTGLRVTGVVRDLALSSTAVAVLAEDRSATRLTLLHPRTGRVLQRMVVPDEARMVSAANRNVVFAVGHEVRLLRIGRRATSTVAVTRVPPAGLSIEGRRVAWIENRGGRGYIRAVTLPR